MPRIEPLRSMDFEPLAELAKSIWLAHYITIITREQIDYMLDGRFTADNLRRYLDANDRWMDVLRLDDRQVGYCSYALTGGPDPANSEMKLEQLYLLPELHGRGLGKAMLDHVEQRAIQQCCNTLMLQVNKRNEKAIRVYDRAGFKVREEVVVEIGNGFVMDDFIMAKQLQT
jgi:diamine N-acetyltransferase